MDVLEQMSRNDWCDPSEVNLTMGFEIILFHKHGKRLITEISSEVDSVTVAHLNLSSSLRSIEIPKMN